MLLKDFKIGDTVIQKNNNKIKWVITKINEEKNYFYLKRKGGFFNEMISIFNGDNQNFEAGARTEQRIKRENKVLNRKKIQDTFEKIKNNKI